jgi:hypothetical protein
MAMMFDLQLMVLNHNGVVSTIPFYVEWLLGGVLICEWKATANRRGFDRIIYSRIMGIDSPHSKKCFPQPFMVNLHGEPLTLEEVRGGQSLDFLSAAFFDRIDRIYRMGAFENSVGQAFLPAIGCCEGLSPEFWTKFAANAKCQNNPCVARGYAGHV